MGPRGHSSTTCPSADTHTCTRTKNHKESAQRLCSIGPSRNRTLRRSILCLCSVMFPVSRNSTNKKKGSSRPGCEKQRFMSLSPPQQAVLHVLHLACIRPLSYQDIADAVCVCVCVCVCVRVGVGVSACVRVCVLCVCCARGDPRSRSRAGALSVFYFSLFVSVLGGGGRMCACVCVRGRAPGGGGGGHKGALQNMERGK